MSKEGIKKQEQNQPLLGKETGISEDDRKEILDSIEEVVSENRISFDQKTIMKTAQSGALFPLFINVVSILVVLAVILILGRSYQINTDTLSRQGIAYASLEGRLLRELQSESQRQLADIDKETNDYESRISELELILQQRGNDMAARISIRKAEYELEIENALNQERERLLSQGISIADVDRLLTIQERTLREYYDGLLADYIAELEQEQLNFEAETRAQQENFSEQLASLRSEREALLQTIRQQEADLRTELEEQAEVVQTNTGNSEELLSNLESARQTLANLEVERERVDATESQLLGLYDRIQQNISQGNLSEAMNLVGQTRAFLNQEAVRTLEPLFQRRNSDFFLLSTLEAHIENLIQTEEEQSAISLDREILGIIRANNERANSAISNNNEEEALLIYSETMSVMPQLQIAYQALSNSLLGQSDGSVSEELVLEEPALQTTEILALVENAEADIASGNYESALDSLESALLYAQEFENLGERISSSFVSIGYGITDGRIRNPNNADLRRVFQRASINADETLNYINEQIQSAESSATVSAPQVANVRPLLNQAESAISSRNYQVALARFEDALQSAPAFENLEERVTNGLILIGYEITDAVIRNRADNASEEILRRASVNTNRIVNFMNDQIQEAIDQREQELLLELDPSQ